MHEIIASLRAAITAGAPSVTVEVLDPDHGRGLFAGEHVEVGGQRYIHRPFRVWVDLAERLELRLLTPRPARPPLVRLTFERLDPRAGWPSPTGDATEKYGAGSDFQRLSKLEDPGLVLDFADALDRARLPERPRILDLGVNTGDELALIMALVPRLREACFVGVDHSASALAVARARFAAHDVTMHHADLGALEGLGLGTFELVLSIGTLQSPAIDDRAVLRHAIQHHASARGAVIFGFPNCRYLDGEAVHGTRMKNFRQPELGLLVKDVAFYRKYLQQHGYQVFVTGKHYILVTGVRGGDSAV